MQWMKPTFGRRILFFVLADILLGLFSLYASYALRFNFAVPQEYLEHFWNVASLMLFAKCAAFFFFKIYYKSWRYFGLKDLKEMIYAMLSAYIFFVFIFLLDPSWFVPMPRSVVIIDFLLSVVLLGGLRISKRIFLERSSQRGNPPALIIGVGNRTPSVIKSALAGDIAYEPVAILSDDSSLIGSYVEGVRVYSFEKLPELVESDSSPVSAIISVEYDPKTLDALVERLDSFGIGEIKRVSLLADSTQKLENIAIEDLLARKPEDLDSAAIAEFIKGKTVLVTGAGGSIGSEITIQSLDFGASRVLMVDNSEYNLYRISERVCSDRAEAILLDIRERDRLADVFEKYRPDIVIHAAAYKHVPLCESNAMSAVRNNVLGVVNVVDLSIEYGVRKVVNISSDKAVRPTNVMGATKRIGELYAQNVESSQSEIVSVRFGNVLDSSGSVVPKFRAQIEAGGPVTVTDPEITRYFMLIPEACRLVLQAAAMARGGELFILDMGEPVKIVDLARKMIRLYGKEGEIDIVFTGLRPGEKLYEELLLDDAECKTKYELIYVASPTRYPIEKLKKDIERLLESGEDVIVHILSEIVPEYSARKEELQR